MDDHRLIFGSIHDTPAPSVVVAKPTTISCLASLAFMGTMNVLFSLKLAFVCNEIWQNRESAKAAMSREAEALRNIGWIASNIPQQGGVPILAAANHYLEVGLSAISRG